MSVIDLSRLSAPERLALIGELWDSLADADVALTPAQQAELQRRAAEVDAGQADEIPWEQVKAEFVARPR